MLLSLDISTSCTGIAIFTDGQNDQNGELMFADFLDLNKSIKNNITVNDERANFDILMQKAEVVINKIHEKFTVADYELTECVVEEPLKSSNNINTCMMLARFNAMVCQRIYQEFAVIPYYISVADWRKYGFGFKNKRGEDLKLKYFNAVMDRYNIPIVYNKKGNIDKRMFDLTDSVGIGLGWMTKKKSESKPK